MAQLQIRLGSEEAACLIGHRLRVDGHTVGRIEGDVTVVEISEGWHLVEVLDITHPTKPLRFHAKHDEVVTTEVHASSPQGILYNAWFDLDKVDQKVDSDHA